jgi:hypothetical protein
MNSKKFKFIVPYLLIVLMALCLGFDKPNYHITIEEQSILVDVIENADGVGYELANRAVEELIISDLVYFKNTDYNFQARRYIYILVIVLNIFCFIRKDVKDTKRSITSEIKGTNTLLMATTGDKTCKIE